MKRRTIFALLFFVGANIVAGQSHDGARMRKDLEITKNILATLMKTDASVVMPDHAIDAEYVENYGVIYYIESNAFAFSVKPDKASRYIIAGDLKKGITGELQHVEEIEQQIALLEKEAGELEKQALEMNRKGEVNEQKIKQIQEQTREIGKQVEEIEVQQRYRAHAPVALSDQLSNDTMEQVVLTFLTEYGHLIGQLSADDRITIRKVHPGSLYVFKSLQDYRHGSSPENQYSITVQKKDLDAFRSGTITLETLRKRITTESGDSNVLPTDIKIFTDIFKKYYSPDLTETFFIGKAPRCELLAGFGVVIHSKMFSSYVHGDVYSMPSVGLADIDAAQRKSTIEDLYPKFEQDIREFILDYGRTIRSLQPSERILLKLEMTKCDSCNIPKSIELVVSSDLLRDYDRQKLNRKKALDGIEIKRQY